MKDQALLRQEISSLTHRNELLQLELTDSRENEQQLRRLVDTLTNSLRSKETPLPNMQDIQINIAGEFTSQRIAELEKELDRYRNCSNQSVDRRVRDIILGYAEMEEEEKRGRQHYPSQNCENCLYLQGEVDRLKGELANQANFKKNQQEIDTWREQCKTLSQEKAKLTREMEDQRKQHLQNQAHTQKELNHRYELLLRQHELALDQLQDQAFLSSRQSEYHRSSMGNPKQNKMMREISSIVNDLSNRKKETTKSKISMQRSSVASDFSTLFSIKDGVNRPKGIYR